MVVSLNISKPRKKKFITRIKSSQPIYLESNPVHLGHEAGLPTPSTNTAGFYSRGTGFKSRPVSSLSTNITFRIPQRKMQGLVS
jgi:hypothetical protein